MLKLQKAEKACVILCYFTISHVIVEGQDNAKK